SFVTFLIFVRPFILRAQGITDVQPRALPVRADFDWPEPDARREFLRVKWNSQGGLELYPTQDSAVLTSTAWADGLVDNPAGKAIRKGELVRFLPYSELYWGIGEGQGPVLRLAARAARHVGRGNRAARRRCDRCRIAQPSRAARRRGGGRARRGEERARRGEPGHGEAGRGDPRRRRDRVFPAGDGRLR